MTEVIEHAVGERIKEGAVNLIVKKSTKNSCAGCFYLESVIKCQNIKCTCTAGLRKDNTNIIYSEVKNNGN
jgi:hypothetical protein